MIGLDKTKTNSLAERDWDCLLSPGWGNSAKLAINLIQETYHLFNFPSQMTFAFHFHTPLGLRELDEALRLQTLLGHREVR